MATMNDEKFRKAQLKARDRMMRFTLWKLRDMRVKYVGRPRTWRLAKELRALKSLLMDEATGSPIDRRHRGRET